MIRTKNVYDAPSLQRANRDAGKFFFSKDTMRFFASRILCDIYKVGDHVIFLTSEKKCFDDPTREYSVRVMNPDGSVALARETYASMYLAKKAARLHAKNRTIPTGEV